MGYKNFNEKGVLGTTGKDYKPVPHESFDKAMQRLKVHALFIAEYMPITKFGKIPLLDEDDALAKNFRICGVTVSGEDKKEGVIITCYKTLSTGFGYVFNTPHTKVQNDGESAYKFIEELMSDIEDIKKEAEEYLGGKVGVKNGQTTLDLEPANLD